MKKDEEGSVEKEVQDVSCTNGAKGWGGGRPGGADGTECRM